MLNIQHPIIQAPMAGVSTPQLAAAVSNAGGLGSIGIGASTVAQAKTMIEETRALTRHPFNVNVFCHKAAIRDHARESDWIQYLSPRFKEFGAEPPFHLNEIYTSFSDNNGMFEMLLEQRPAVVSFHFGLPPAKHIEMFRRAGIKLLACATNTDEAMQIECAGFDGIVAQGIEAGGHRGMFDPELPDEQYPTATLVKLILRTTTLPVIATGGIMDGRGIKAMLDLGAVAAQLGTAFILCPESAASAAYRANLTSVRAWHTRLTASLSGRPARGIVNRFIEFAEQANRPSPAAYPVAYDLAKQLHAAASSKGTHEFAAHWAGQGAPLARSLPAAEMMRILVSEMNLEFT